MQKIFYFDNHYLNLEYVQKIYVANAGWVELTMADGETHRVEYKSRNDALQTVELLIKKIGAEVYE